MYISIMNKSRGSSKALYVSWAEAKVLRSIAKIEKAKKIAKKSTPKRDKRGHKSPPVLKNTTKRNVIVLYPPVTAQKRKTS